MTPKGKKHPDFPNYIITKCGKVYSLYYNKYNKPSTTSAYYKYTLVQKKIKKCLSIHRLLALLYIPNPNNHPIVNHLDGNKLNNNISNLEWCTYSHNMKHAFAIGLSLPTLGEDSHVSKLTEKEVLEIRKLYLIGDTTQRKLAKQFNTCYQNINFIVNRKTWSHI